jgi:hypothetical protein
MVANDTSWLRLKFLIYCTEEGQENNTNKNNYNNNNNNFTTTVPTKML